jgi:hypothetical protein
MEMQIKIENPNIDVLKSLNNVKPNWIFVQCFEKKSHNNICNLIISCVYRNWFNDERHITNHRKSIYQSVNHYHGKSK